MKIIHVANIRLPTEKAHGIQIMKMCEALAAVGVNVELVVPSRTDNHLKMLDPFDYYSVKKKFEVKYLFSFDPGFLRALKQGIYIKFQSFFFLISLFFYLLFRGRGEILYTRNEYLLPLLLKFSKRVFWEPHTLPKNQSAYLGYWKKCAGIIAISGGLIRELVKLGIDGQKMIVAPDGVDLEKFSARGGSAFGGKSQELVDKNREELGLPPDAKLVMYTGHLYEWKGAGTLLAASRSPKFQNKNIRFVFVGGTKYDIARFQKQASGVENILILGHRPYSEIPKYLAAADVLVLPNSGKFEISRTQTSPLKLFEYMASNRPIIASDLPSIREILDESTALLAEPDNPGSLADGIFTILNDENLGRKIAENAGRKAREYTWEKRAQKVISAIRGALTQSRI